MPAFTGTANLVGTGTLTVGALQRLRIVTPERLDGLVADLVNSPLTSSGLAVANKAGTGTPSSSGVSAPTPSTLMQRDAAGRAQVVSPSVAADIATKNYVDTTAVLASTKGVANGVAALDSSGNVSTAQLGTIGRNLGSGTTFPSSPGVGDFYTHTGLGANFRWGGSRWEQQSRATVASRAARDTLLTTYSSVMPVGFTVTQSDFGWIWRRATNSQWLYAGWEGATDGIPWSTGSTNQGPIFMYQSLNRTLTSGAAPIKLPFTFLQNGTADTERELVVWDSTNKQWNLRDNCVVTVSVTVTSDFDDYGNSIVKLRPPGGSAVVPTGYVADNSARTSATATYSGSGQLIQNLRYTGYVSGPTSGTPTNSSQLWVEAAQINQAAQPVTNYCAYMSIQFLPV